jgi:hypothetical protein
MHVCRGRKHPSSAELAALTIASVCSVVMSPRHTTKPVAPTFFSGCKPDASTIPRSRNSPSSTPSSVAWKSSGSGEEGRMVSSARNNALGSSYAPVLVRRRISCEVSSASSRSTRALTIAGRSRAGRGSARRYGSFNDTASAYSSSGSGRVDPKLMRPACNALIRVATGYVVVTRTRRTVVTWGCVLAGWRDRSYGGRSQERERWIDANYSRAD